MSKPEITIRDATREDVAWFHAQQEADAHHNHTHTLESSIRAWVVEKDGHRACLTGVVFGKRYIEAFSDIAPGIDVPKRTVWRYAKILAERIKALNLPVIAFAKESKNSAKFLESVGFHYAIDHQGRKIYRL